MNDDVVRARIDAKTKRAADTVLRKIGLTPSGAFRLMMTRVAAEKRLPFEPLNPNAETVAAMRQARRGTGMTRVKDSAALLKSLNAKGR